MTIDDVAKSLLMTSREFGSIWTANILCTNGALGSLEQRFRLEIHKTNGQYEVHLGQRRYTDGEPPRDGRRVPQGEPCSTLAEAATYVEEYIRGYEGAAADDRAAAFEAQLEQDQAEHY